MSEIQKLNFVTSVDKVLRKLTHQDLNTMSFTELQSSILDLSVKEISMLCGVSRRFNKIGEDEPFWRRKVLYNYGINKRYGATWRETAKRFYITNMINLGARWANDQTYREVLDEYLNRGADELYYNQMEMLDKIFQNEDAAHDMLIIYNPSPQEIRNFSRQFHLDRELTDAEIDKIRLITSRDIEVIKSVILILIHSTEDFLPGTADDNTVGEMDYNGENHEFLRKLIDPVPYVMQSSSFTEKDFRIIEQTYTPL